MILALIMAGALLVKQPTTANTWRPNPGPQMEALSRSEYELGMGGSRGGSKTETGLAFMVEPEYIRCARYSGLVIRKNKKDLANWLSRARQMYSCLGARIVEHPDQRIKFASGATICLGHLKDANAYEQWQGQEFQKINVEELTQIPYEEWYLKLISSCRSTTPGLSPQVFSSFNPGGPGHCWVRDRFVRCCRNKTFTYQAQVGGRTISRSRIFIPSSVDDTPQILQHDPGYVVFLESLPEQLRQAWRFGNWDVIMGAYFDTLDERKHLVTPFNIPSDWLRFRSIDYGYGHFAACVWWAVDPDGNTYIYRYLKEKGLLCRKFAQKIKTMSGGEKFVMNLAGHDLWAHVRETDTPTIKLYSDIFIQEQVPLVKAVIDRVPGWGALQDGLSWEIDILGQATKPAIQIFRGCDEVLHDLAACQRDDKNLEDVKKFPGDDIPDAVRYGWVHIYKAFKPETAKTQYEQIVAKLPFNNPRDQQAENWETY